MDGDSQPKRTKVWRLPTALLLVAVTLWIMPTLLCRTSVAQRIISEALSLNSGEVQYESLRMGWWTPISISRINLGRTSDPNRLTIDHINSDVTFGQLILGMDDSWGNWTLRGVKIHTVAHDSHLGIEQLLLNSVDDDTSDRARSGRIVIQDFEALIQDAQSRWTLQSSEFVLSTSGNNWCVQTGLRIISPTGHTGTLRIDCRRDANLGTSLTLQAKKLDLAPVAFTCNRFEFASTAKQAIEQILADQVSKPDHALNLWGRPTGQISGRFDADFGTKKTNRLHFDQCVVESLSLTPLKTPETSFNSHHASLDGTVISDDSRTQIALRGETDFGTIQCDVSMPSLSKSKKHKWGILDKIAKADGEGHLSIDYNTLSQCVPRDWIGIDHNRTGSRKITSDRPLGKLEFHWHAVGSTKPKRNTLELHSGPLAFKIGNKRIRIPRAHLVANAQSSRDRWHIQSINFESAFLTLQAKGTQRGGSANWILRGGPVVESFLDLRLSELRDISGTVEGVTSWKITQSPEISIESEISSDTLRFQTQLGEESIVAPMKSKVCIKTQMTSSGQPELLSTSIDSAGDALKIHATLNSTTNPSHPRPTWLFEAEGELYPVVNAIRPWLPAGIVNADGHGKLTVSGDHENGSFVIRHASAKSQNPRIAWGRRLIKTQRFSANFDGAYRVATGELSVKRCTANSDSLNASLSGQILNQVVDAELQWEYDLQRESRFKSFSSNLLIDRSEDSSVGRVIAGARHHRIDRTIEGRFGGTVRVTGDDRSLDIHSDSQVHGLAVVERIPIREIDQQASILLAGSQQGKKTLAASDKTSPSGHPFSLWRVLWSEPEVSLTVHAHSTRGTDQFQVKQAQLSASSFSATSSGFYHRTSEGHDLRIDGDLDIRFPQLGNQLSHLAGIPIHLHGNRRSPFTIRLAKTGSKPIAFLAETLLKWDAGEMAGVAMGAAEIPLALSQNDLRILGGNIPVGHGHLHLDGLMNYRSAPSVLEIYPGTIAESIELTPEITDRWIRFIAPPVQRVSDIKGNFSIKVDEARVVLSNPKDSRIVGRLMIDRASMSLTPMVRALIQSAKRFYADSESIDQVETQGLVIVPKQQIEFYLDLGIIHHKRAVIEVDGVRLASTGDVTTDGKLAIVTEIPIDQLLSRAPSPEGTEKILTMPVTGSVYQPKVDPTGIGGIVTLVGRALPKPQEKRSPLSTDSAQSSVNRTKSLLETISRVFRNNRPALKKR